MFSKNLVENDVEIYQKSKTIVIIGTKECIMWLDVSVANVVKLVKSDEKNNAKNSRHYKMKIYAMKLLVRFSTE